jgi:hypothetical protein
MLVHIMFRQFLDVADYWFGYSDNSSARSYNPAQECFVVLANDQANAAKPSLRGLTRELDRTRVRGQARLPPHHRGGPTSTRNWLKGASSKPSLRSNTVRCGYFAPPSPGKLPCAASARTN